MARSEALQMNLAPKDEQNYYYHSFVSLLQLIVCSFGGGRVQVSMETSR